MDNVIQSIPLIELVTSEMHPHLEFQTDNNLDNLINSIKKYGIIEPLLIRKKDNKFEIILGNRRYNAAKQLGLERVPAIITNIDDEKALNLIISDNIQRKELSAKEEARLYEKALSYPNINIEQLSINLGIPLDRITSKLELLKKENPTDNKLIDNKQSTNAAQYENKNNSVNNDIINLTELNKKESERDEIYMNNSNMMENNMNNNMNNGVENSVPQTPTFGGRFFPSMEDEPTNMNMNGINPQPMPNNNLQSEMDNNVISSPLIDLTDTSSDNIAPQSVEQTPEPSPQPASPTIPEPAASTNMIEPNIPELDQSINQSLPPLDQPIPIDQLNNNINNNYNSIESPIPEQPIVEQPIPNINQAPQPEIPNIGEFPNNNVPMPEQNFVETPTIEQPLNIDNLPNVNIPEPAPQVNIPNYNVETPSQEKDILPVVNMIKNLAMSIESLGYKLNISENDNNESYSINIEVEK